MSYYRTLVQKGILKDENYEVVDGKLKSSKNRHISSPTLECTLGPEWETEEVRQVERQVDEWVKEFHGASVIKQPAAVRRKPTATTTTTTTTTNSPPISNNTHTNTIATTNTNKNSTQSMPFSPHKEDNVYVPQLMPQPASSWFQLPKYNLSPKLSESTCYYNHYQHKKPPPKQAIHVESISGSNIRNFISFKTIDNMPLDSQQTYFSSRAR